MTKQDERHNELYDTFQAVFWEFQDFTREEIAAVAGAAAQEHFDNYGDAGRVQAHGLSVWQRIQEWGNQPLEIT